MIGGCPETAGCFFWVLWLETLEWAEQRAQELQKQSAERRRPPSLLRGRGGLTSMPGGMGR